MRELEDIAACAQLACILEVSAPKPGNVNRLYDFKDTKFEDFVSSGVAIGSPVSRAADRGYRAGKGEIDLRDIGIGDLIKEAVFNSFKWHSGKNTNLGLSMLLIPLGASAGMSIANGGELRGNIDQVMRNTTPKDAIDLYGAIRRANPGGLGTSEELDVNSPDSDRKIEEDGINMYRVMQASKADYIARELVTAYEISFDTGFPVIAEASSKGGIGDAIVQAYLTILSKFPDTLISRKNGVAEAEKVSCDAKAVLDGKMDISELDSYLRGNENRLNPGTTADLTASSLMIALLEGAVP